MSRRKILIVFIGLSLVAVGLGFCIPQHEHDPLAERILAYLDLCGEQPGDKAMNSDKPATIQVEIRAVSLPAFSNHAKQGKPVAGVATDLLHFLSAVQNVRRAHITQWPRLTLSNGQPAVCEAPMVRRGIGKDGATVLKSYGFRFDATPTLRKDGRIHLQFAAELASPPDRHLPENVMHANASFVLNDQQTGVIGGLKRECIDRSDYHVPMLSELPAIGPWFRVPSEREIDEELFILVTPKLVLAP